MATSKKPTSKVETEKPVRVNKPKVQPTEQAEPSSTLVALDSLHDKVNKIITGITTTSKLNKIIWGIAILSLIIFGFMIFHHSKRIDKEDQRQIELNKKLEDVLKELEKKAAQKDTIYKYQDEKAVQDYEKKN